MKRFPTLMISLFMLGSLSFMSSCEYDHPVPEELPDVISFSNDIIPYFNASCNFSGCHNTGGVSPDLTPANAYDDLFAKNQINLENPEQSTLYMKIAPGGSMAPYSNSSQTAMVLKWITQGAENN